MNSYSTYYFQEIELHILNYGKQVQRLLLILWR